MASKTFLAGRLWSLRRGASCLSSIPNQPLVRLHQGTAGPDQFRTAPLWGIGQRLFFLHDGRTSDLLQAIEGHAGCTGARGHDQDRDHHRFNNCNSEAYRVINNFNALSPSQQQDILNFLRSL